jgi:hypothetical protein
MYSIEFTSPFYWPDVVGGLQVAVNKEAVMGRDASSLSSLGTYTGGLV